MRALGRRSPFLNPLQIPFFQGSIPPPVIARRPSCGITIPETGKEWPWKRSSWPLLKSHILKVPSLDPETARCSAGVIVIAVTESVWPDGGKEQSATLQVLYIEWFILDRILLADHQTS